MTLSYDCTFFALWLMALHKKCLGFREGRCVVNPLKKCGACIGGGDELRLASALSVIMVYQKVRDNIADDRFLKRMKSYMVLPFVSQMRRKAAKDYPELDKIVALAMMEQAAAEQNPGQSIDFYAEPTAKMMEQVFAFGAAAPELSPEDRLVRQAGDFLGRWVYIIDAADDLEKDLYEGAFNPFIIKEQLQPNCPTERLKEVKEEANRILNEAEEYCNEYMDGVKADVAVQVEQINKKSLADRKLYEEKTKSGGEFRKRKTILMAKQSCINEVIEKAEKTFLELESEEYFKLMLELFKANVTCEKGKILFNEKDLSRMPQWFKDEINQAAKEKGGEIKINEKPENIDGGFILTYGDIEENCTVKSLFMANSDKLKDVANKVLFGTGN